MLNASPSDSDGDPYPPRALGPTNRPPRAGKAKPVANETSASCRPPHSPSVTPKSVARDVTVAPNPPMEEEEGLLPLLLVVEVSGCAIKRSAVNSRAERMGPVH